MKKWRDKQFNKDLGEHHQCCTRCYLIKPKADNGENHGMVKLDGSSKLQEAMVPYKSCKACRDKQRVVIS